MLMNENRLLMWICTITLFAILLIALDCGAVIKEVQTETCENILLIDPGHGGMDGGAVAADGTMEKDINLAIARQLRRAAEAEGWQVIMTRETDEWLCSREEGSIRSRKTEDLRNRCEMISKYRPGIAVSIHLNSFKEDPSVKGSQVFYPENADDECIRFARAVQSGLNGALKAEKERSAMVREDVMIFRDTKCPVIIVECGFLSNPEEAGLLQKKSYHKQITQGIMDGITEFTGVKKPQTIEIIDSSS